MLCPLCLSVNEDAAFQLYEADCKFVEIDNIDQHLIRHQCPNCDVIFGTRQMLTLPEDKLIAAYEKVYTSGYQEGDSTDFQLYTFNLFNPKKGGIYINWGAGNSKISNVIRDKGFNIIDYDPFAQGLYPDKYASEGYVLNNKFDGIMSNSVIEHFQDPVKELIKMKSVLKENAFMLHSTDCYQYRIEWTKYHLYFFVGRSLNVLCQRSNLKHEIIDDMRVKFW